MICDLRCVACNVPLLGREEVTIRKTLPPKRVECKACGTQQIRTKGVDLTDYHYTREV